MGEIADMMIDGTLDAHTGEYLGEGPGYPRTRDKSLPWEAKRPPNPTYGVTHWLDTNGVKGADQIEVIRRFFPDEKGIANISKDELCQKISARFDEFKKYVKTNL